VNRSGSGTVGAPENAFSFRRAAGLSRKAWISGVLLLLSAALFGSSLQVEQRIDHAYGRQSRAVQLAHALGQRSQTLGNGPERASLLAQLRETGITEGESALILHVLTQTDAAVATGASRLGDAQLAKLAADTAQSILEFDNQVNERTRTIIDQLERTALALRISAGLAGVLLVLTWIRFYRAIRATLGAPANEIYERIEHLGRGDLDVAFPVPAGLEFSVIGRLAEAQARLSSMNAQRAAAEAKNRRMNQIYNALSQCDQAIVRCRSEEELFEQICCDLVLWGGMTMAWVGVVDPRRRAIRVAAADGSGTEYLADLELSTDDRQQTGRGPTAIAVRGDRPYWCEDWQNDPATKAWRTRAAPYGWRAAASLPLHRNGTVVAALTLYSTDLGIFDEAVKNLLLEASKNIDYALNAFESEARRQRALADLARSRGLLQTVIDTAPLRIYWKDREHRYLGGNELFVKDAGCERPLELIGKRDADLPHGDFSAPIAAQDHEMMASGVPRLFQEILCRTPGGEQRWLRLSKVPLKNETDGIIGILGVYEDVTEQRVAQERIQYLANFDSLTGLPNRIALNEQLRKDIGASDPAPRRFALMFLDLDNFKDINDALGHRIGDLLLVELAQRLKSSLRAHDTVARLGGDEFVLVLRDTDTPGAGAVAEAVLAVVRESYRIEQYDLTLSASIGIAVHPDDGLSEEALFKSADAAMYQAKNEGRNNYRFSTPRLHERSSRHLQLVSSLRTAIDQGGLHLQYQPQISLHDDRIIGAEALLRWQHPQLGSIAPAEFIPLAEQSGQILAIGEWVLRSAVRQARCWRDRGMKNLVMAVNLSAVQLRQTDLPDLVSRILAEEGLAPELLELELTESMAMHNVRLAVSIMREMRARGVRISIDDFGTGHSSLSYLQKFDAQKLKIDQSFVREIRNDPDDEAIVCTVILMAKRLGLVTIAEGVETQGQLNFLRKHGCDEAQGYHISRPLEADRFEAFADAYANRRAMEAGRNICPPPARSATPGCSL